jgi:low temperature requirement protein LtrA
MSEQQLTHRVRPMSGRDPDQDHRAATPLELLFDLAFVVAFGTAANELAHYLVVDRIEVGVFGFLFATFAISWAWINFAWFASAYDTDDWIYRLTTMVQMVGVLVLSLGLSDMFASLEEGDHVDNAVMVAGYVVMRVAMTFQWLRASRDDPARRAACLTNVGYVLAAQVGWIVLLVAQTSALVTVVCIVFLVLVELAGPVLAETRHGGIPWHADHIAERYGLLVIIALGEGMIGTMASMSAIVGPHGEGWSVDFVLVGLAGVAITFGMWWVYFVIPHGAILTRRRERSVGWGYGHIPLFGATVAVGAGLHVAAYYLEHHSELGALGTTVAVALPLAVYLLMVFVLYAQLTHSLDPFHLVLVALTAVIVGAAVLLAAAGVSLAVSLTVLALSPWVTVVGYELVGHRHNERVVAAL